MSTVLQVSEFMFPELMNIVGSNLNSIFGANTSPIATFRARDLFFDGILLCENPTILGFIICNQIKATASYSKNIEILDSGAMKYSLFDYKTDIPSEVYEIRRGIEDHSVLGDIVSFDGASRLLYWADLNQQPEAINDQGYSHCNMLNGTDTKIFAPFVDEHRVLYGFNSDVCRSVELRYQHESSYEGVPTRRFSANEWFLDNADGCFCVNATRGLTRQNGCLLQGAQEMFTCTGALLVLTYPHFLYADTAYQNGVIGVTPDEDQHRIFLDLEPYTGTVVQGFKKAQFNIFLRPITGVDSTQALKTTLTPLFWVEDGIQLDDELLDVLRSSLLRPLRTTRILIPTLLAAACAMILLGVVLTVRARRSTTPRPPQPVTNLEAQYDTKLEAKPVTKLEAQPDTKFEAQPDTNLEAQPDTKLEAQPDTKLEAQLDTKFTTQPNPKLEAQPTAKNEA